MGIVKNYITIPLWLIYICVGSCNTINDLSKVCVSYKTEDLNMSLFNMITGINELKILRKQISCNYTHPTTRHCGDVVTTSLFTSQQHRKCVSNETPNDVLMESCQNVLILCLQDVLLERRGNVSRGCNNDVPSILLHNV